MKPLLHKPLHPVLLLVLIFLSGALGIGWLAASVAKDVDAESLRVSQLALNQELARERRQLASSLQDYASWDEMNDKLNRQVPDMAWLNQNLTASVYYNLNVHLALLVDANDGVLLARRNGMLSADPARELPLSKQQWLTLLRSTDRYEQHDQTTLPSQLLRVDSINPQTGYPEPRILLLSIQRIKAEQLPDTPGPYRRYLVFARYLDQAALQQLATAFLLPEARLYFTADSPVGLSSLPLQDNNGQTLAWLAWPAQTPGNAMLERILPQSAALLLLILLLGAAIVRMAERWQRESRQQASRLQQQGAALQKLVTSRRDDQQELREYLEEVMPLLSQTLRVSRVSVWQFSPDGKELVCLAGLNTSNGQFNYDDTLEQTQHADYFQAIRQQRYLTTDHAQLDERLQSLRTYLVARDVHAMLDATIMVGGLHHGILCMESQQPQRQWQQDEINFVCSAADILALVIESRARLHAEGELYRQFYYDRFTGLPNRSRMLMQLDELIQQKESQPANNVEPLGCLMLAVEGLTNINELYGRDNGDLVIRELGKRLELLTENGEMVARSADNRFALLMLGRDEERLCRRVDALVSLLNNPLELQGQQLYIRLSIGLALYPQDTNDAESLLEHAEMALQMSREGPGDWVRFHPDINSNWRRRNRLQTELRQAIARNEMLLNYQPYVSLKTGKVAGAEALVRWQHPELGLVSPADFIPMAEETGVIHAIGAWVLEEGIRHAANWRLRFLENFTISINVSLLQLEDPHFAESVTALLATHHLPGEALELEVTEGLALRNTPEIDGNLHKLRAQGIAIAIDDFGTGYASFSYLRRFPVEKLKIDKQFLDRVPDSEAGSNLVRMIVSMGHTLGASVTGEGIENIEQARFLARHGCDYAQGYLISKPLGAGALERFLVDAEALPL
ncbi:MAG: EAL domain-containing protein [Vogesella sp.]|uniref:EAL domain-containing protein n=1 Tax=Vogesella sp. TaxID=1904252 RepID=UPI00391BB08A